jgi:hypothetical protein
MRNMKWTRHDSRGILTPREREILKNGNWVVDRHAKLKIRLKTLKAVNDLELIFAKMKPIDFISADMSYFDTKITRAFLKRLLIYYCVLEERNCVRERIAKNVKRQVAFRDVWKQVKELIRETKTEIQK